MMDNPNENKRVLSQDLDDRKIEVQEDGKVKVTETIKTVYIQEYRDFLTDVRQMQKYREQIEDTLKPDFNTKQKDRMSKIDDEVAKLQPFLDESEKKFIANQETERLNSFVKGIREQLEKPEGEVNLNYVGAIWDNLKKSSNFDKVSEELTSEELDKFKRLKLKATRKEKR